MNEEKIQSLRKRITGLAHQMRLQEEDLVRKGEQERGGKRLQCEECLQKGLGINRAEG